MDTGGYGILEALDYKLIFLFVVCTTNVCTHKYNLKAFTVVVLFVWFCLVWLEREVFLKKSAWLQKLAMK